MAITIKDIPVDTGEVLVPAYNKTVFVVDSDKTTEANFNYIADIYITGVTAPTYFRLRKPADPTTGFAEFDVGRIVEDYIIHDLDLTTTGFQENANSYKSWRVKFGEEFGASSSGVTAYPDLTVSNLYYSWNGALDFIERQSYLQGGYALLGGSTKPFLTNAPTSGLIALDEDAWLHMMTYASGHIEYMQIEDYNDDGSSIQISKVNNAFKAYPNEQSRFLRFSAGPNNINDIAAGQITQGSQPMVSPGAKKYYIQAFNASDQASSEQYWFTIDDQCTKHTTYRLHFLNQLGGFDSFTFLMAAKHRAEVERKTFKKNFGGHSAAGVWSYNIFARGKTQHHTKVKDKLTLQSDWVSEATLTWLEELVSSPEVFYYDGTNLIAVNMLTSTHERKTVAASQVFNMVIEIEFSYDRYRQRS